MTTIYDDRYIAKASFRLTSAIGTKRLQWSNRIPDKYPVISGARIPDKYPVISGARIPDKYLVISDLWCQNTG